MPEERGYIRLYDLESKVEYRAIVLVLQIDKTFNFCPVWKESVNKLVPIMRTDKDHPIETPFDGKCEFYIDASDPFAYELWTHKTLKDRIDEFNDTYKEREVGEIKIIKIASVSDLERAGLPAYKEAGSKRVILLQE